MSTPTTSPIGATAAAAGTDAGGCGDDGGDELCEMAPMLCLYYDADEASNDQQTHDYLTASTCFKHDVSPCRPIIRGGTSCRAGGRMPPRLRCNGASIGLCPHTFEWLHSLCSTWGEGRQ